MIETEILIGWGITGAMIAGHIFVANYRIDRNEKEQEADKKQTKEEIEEVWKWKNAHEKDANDMREKFQTQLSELKGEQRVVGEQFKQIMTALTEIKTRITELEESHRRRD